MNTVTQRIKCPKCQRNAMRKSLGKNMIEKEYFCDQCHVYFGLGELVAQWGYDCGDLGDVRPAHFIGTISMAVYFDYAEQEKKLFQSRDTVSPILGEPEWLSNRERDEAYEVVNEMFMGIESWDDLMDLKETQECALGRG